MRYLREPPDWQKVDEQNSRTVLVIDDCRLGRGLICRCLSKLGIEFDEAANGAEAYRLATQKTYDLILSNIKMPVMDGIEFAKRIRVYQEREGDRVPIVAVTGCDTAEHRRLCLEAGMDEHLAKPYPLKELIRVLDQWLFAGSGYLTNLCTAERNSEKI